MASSSTWQTKLVPLTEHGKWALVGRYRTPNAAHVAASNLRTGKTPGVPSGEWRFVVKRTDESALLFARYLGTAAG